MSNFVFDIDWGELSAIANEIEASEKQIVFSLNRAMRRTATTLRRMSARGLVSELNLRSARELKKRLKLILRSGMNSTGRRRSGSDVTIWYGLNDMPVSSFKGTARQNKTGAEFRGDQFDGAFVAKSKIKGKRTIFKRKGKERLPITEQTIQVADKAMDFIYDEVFVDKMLDIFWDNFKRDLNARVKFQIGER